MIDSRTFQQYASDPAAFRRDLLIDCDGQAVRFGDVVEPWQRADFQATDPGWLMAVGRKQKGKNFPSVSAASRAWLERPRGHAKTSDIASMAVWALVSAVRPISGFGAAADRDQARLLRDSIRRLVSLNPWLGQILEVQSYTVRNVAASHPGNGSELQILSSDAATSFGLLPDFVVCDELCHWTKPDLWDSLLSSAAKRSNCMLLVISNAGFTDSWQWDVREAIRQDPDWYFSRLSGPRASWITQRRLDEQRRLLPEVAYRRLWLNEWSAGSGDALPDDLLTAAVKGDLQPIEERQEGFVYVGGLDLGISRDASGLAVLGVDVGRTERKVVDHVYDDWLQPKPVYETVRHGGDRRIRLAKTKLWKPERGKLDLQTVEDAVFRAWKQFRLQEVRYDPWQAEHLAQRLRRRGVPMVEVAFTGGNLRQMASTVLEAFNDRRVDLFDEPQLLSDLRRMRVVEKSYGWRLESPRDASGHGDLGTAFVLGLLAAAETAPERQMTDEDADRWIRLMS